MKIKDGFVLREIAGNWVVIPVGNRVVEFNSIISLNKSGSMLWEQLQNGANKEDLVQYIINSYEIDEVTARDDVAEFINAIDEKGLLEND